MKRTIKSLVETFPILHRYLGLNFFKNFLIIFTFFSLLIFLISSLNFLNFVKSFSSKLMLEYALFSTIVYTPLFVPILELAAVAKTIYPFIERKLNWSIFAAGIPPTRFIFPFLVVSSFISLLLTLHFQFLYPKAEYIQHLDYLRAKNKPLNEGIAENFWFKNDKGYFLHFQLIDLKGKKAFDGLYFKVNKNFNLQKVAYIPKADFKIDGNMIEIEAKNVNIYTKKGVEEKSILKLKIPYERKLLRVKKPSYFSLTELKDLILFSKKVGINYYPYLWELIKRLIVLVLTILVPSIAGMYLFSSTRLETFFKRITLLLVSLIGFYVALLLFQTLVFKNSTNPLYGLILIIPFAAWLLAIIGKEKINQVLIEFRDRFRL
ncbi:MAG TPA: LptF/LptG family permease [Aquificales bacterium]|nr:LptF/LptG family permease [Aquificales bacterium]